MTETPFGRDGTSAVDRSVDPYARSADAVRPRRRRPPPVKQGVPADTLAMLLLLVVILVVVVLGASVVT